MPLFCYNKQIYLPLFYYKQIKQLSFNRSLEQELKAWKERRPRKPLIIRGARQVGKTTLVKRFASTYKYSILLNLEKASDRRFFDDFEDVHSIFEALFLAHQIPPTDIGSTLLFIDEIQENPRAIQLLRYFYEELSELHVISAGSLLEFALGDVKRFPVGRVDFMYLYPLNFPEYLQATGKSQLLQALNEVPVKPVAHQLSMDAFHRYAIIGGMPEIIRTDIEQNNLASLPGVYESIWATYKNDVEKYTTSDNARKIIRHIMNTAPLYIDERIKFHGFGNSNYRSREVGDALRTLENAKVIRLIYPTVDLHPPVKPDLKKSPRLQILDTGIVNYSLGIQGDMLAMDDLSAAYKGAIIPHIVTQEIISLQVITDSKPDFWVREKPQSNAEVDLVLTYKNMVIPIEIKSGSTGSLRSLHQFIESVDHPYAIRIYGGKFIVEKAITPNKKTYLLMNLPYYLGTKIRQYIEWFVREYAET